jgi:hypothetical protein
VSQLSHQKQCSEAINEHVSHDSCQVIFSIVILLCALPYFCGSHVHLIYAQNAIRSWSAPVSRVAQQCVSLLGSNVAVGMKSNIYFTCFTLYLTSSSLGSYRVLTPSPNISISRHQNHTIVFALLFLLFRKRLPPIPLPLREIDINREHFPFTIL